MSDAPSQWPIEPLSELGQWVGGGTPSKDRPDYWTGGTIPWVSPKDMKVPVLHTAEDRITELAVAESSTRVVPAPSVFLVTRSGILSRTLPVAVTAVDAALNQDLKALVPREGVNPHFVAYALKSAEREILKECSKHGTTVASIDLDRLLRVTVPVPPESEQAEVVAGLDSQLSRLAGASSTLERVRTNLKRYQASVLRAAVTGRLVPTEASLARAEGRSFEPASELLARILEERRARWQASGKRGKYKEPVPPDTAGLPELPEGWCWATVEQLSETVTYGTSIKTTDDPALGVPVLRMGNIIDGRLDWESLKYLPAAHDEFPDLLLQSGDLLFNRTNSPELVGKSAVFMGHTGPVSFASYLLRVRFGPSVDSTYVSAAINSYYGRMWVRSVVTQQVGQANVNGSKLKAFAVPLPPVSEQYRIVAELSRVLTTATSTEASVEVDLSRLKSMRSSILQAAFRGEFG